MLCETNAIGQLRLRQAVSGAIPFTWESQGGLNQQVRIVASTFRQRVQVKQPTGSGHFVPAVGEKALAPSGDHRDCRVPQPVDGLARPRPGGARRPRRPRRCRGRGVA